MRDRDLLQISRLCVSPLHHHIAVEDADTIVAVGSHRPSRRRFSDTTDGVVFTCRLVFPGNGRSNPDRPPTFASDEPLEKRRRLRYGDQRRRGA